TSPGRAASRWRPATRRRPRATAGCPCRPTSWASAHLPGERGVEERLELGVPGVDPPGDLGQPAAGGLGGLAVERLEPHRPCPLQRLLAGLEVDAGRLGLTGVAETLVVDRGDELRDDVALQVGAGRHPGDDPTVARVLLADLLLH